MLPPVTSTVSLTPGFTASRTTVVSTAESTTTPGTSIALESPLAISALVGWVPPGTPTPGASTVNEKDCPITLTEKTPGSLLRTSRVILCFWPPSGNSISVILYSSSESWWNLTIDPG